MSTVVTDQFRILNTNNFVETVDDSANSYYITLGLANQHLQLGLVELLHGIPTHLIQQIISII